MKWSFVFRSTYERRVKGLQDELDWYRRQLDQLRRANIADIAEFIVKDFPDLQKELKENRDAFIGKGKK